MADHNSCECPHCIGRQQRAAQVRRIEALVELHALEPTLRLRTLAAMKSDERRAAFLQWTPVQISEVLIDCDQDCFARYTAELLALDGGRRWLAIRARVYQPIARVRIRPVTPTDFGGEPWCVVDVVDQLALQAEGIAIARRFRSNGSEELLARRPNVHDRVSQIIMTRRAHEIFVAIDRAWAAYVSAGQVLVEAIEGADAIAVEVQKSTASIDSGQRACDLPALPRRAS